MMTTGRNAVHHNRMPSSGRSVLLLSCLFVATASSYSFLRSLGRPSSVILRSSLLSMMSSSSSSSSSSSTSSSSSSNVAPFASSVKFDNRNLVSLPIDGDQTFSLLIPFAYFTSLHFTSLHLTTSYSLFALRIS